MAGIKIVDLPALGRDLAATDLLELSLAGGTGSRKITGQEIMNASKLSVGNTPIINGAVGQVLFQGTGNVLQESANLFWDNTNSNLGVGIGSPAARLDVITSANKYALRLGENTANGDGSWTGIKFQLSTNTSNLDTQNGAMNIVAYRYSAGSQLSILNSTTTIATFGSASNSLLIGTTTDAGFKLDVNGTARVQDNLLLTNGIIATSAGLTRLQSSLNYFSHQRLASSGAFGWDIRNSAGTQIAFWNYDAGSGNVNFGGTVGTPLLLSTNNTTRATITVGGNVLINTTTDSGYRLDVNGTARISNATWDGTALLLQGPSPGRALHVLENSLVLFDSPLTMRGSLINFYEPTGLSTATTLGEITSGGAHWGASNVTRILFAASGGVWSGSSKPTKITFSTTNVGNITATEKISIEPSGNLLIGTTTDAGYRLDVNGTARATLFYSGASNYADSIGVGISVDGANFSSSFNASNANMLLLKGSSRFAYLASVGAMYYFCGRYNGSASTWVPTDFMKLQLSGSEMWGISSGTATTNAININLNLNFTGGTSTVKGIYYNPTLTSMTGVTHFAFHSTSGRVRFEGLPTSPTGLNAGDLWNDAGTLRIV